MHHRRTMVLVDTGRTCDDPRRFPPKTYPVPCTGTPGDDAPLVTPDTTDASGDELRTEADPVIAAPPTSIHTEPGGDSCAIGPAGRATPGGTANERWGVGVAEGGGVSDRDLRPNGRSL